MNKIESALKLAKDCTYADEMMESAKEHLRNVIDEALTEVNKNFVLADVSGECLHPYSSVRRDKITELCTCADCGKEWY